MDGNYSIAASFAIITRNINAYAGPHGSISPSGDTKVDYGGLQTFTITPDTGYHVADVLVDGVSVGAVESYTFVNVTKGHNINASFAINTYVITATAGPHGAISPSGNTTIEHGASQNFTITPDTDYHIADVLVDGTSVGALGSYTFTRVSANHTIAASFAVNTLAIQSSAGEHGSISPSGNTTVDYGASRTFTITPDAGYHIADVLVDGESVGAVGTFTFSGVTVSHTIAASFAINTYTIRSTAGEHGAISPSGNTTIEHGDSQNFTITADDGYHIADVLVDGTSVGALGSYTFTRVSANHTIAASFAVNTITIRSTAGEHGAISPSGNTTVEYGASQNFTITADDGYHIADVLVDGTSVGALGSYTFADVSSNHTIAASFAVNARTITATAAPTITWPIYALLGIVAAGLVTFLSFRLMKRRARLATGTLKIYCDPPGSDIFLDGEPQGPADASGEKTIARILPGVYTVKITSRAGFSDWSKQVRIVGRNVTVLYAYLATKGHGAPSRNEIITPEAAELYGSLEVTVSHWMCDIYVGSEPGGQPDARGKRMIKGILHGHYIVKVTSPDFFKDWTGPVTIHSGQTTTLNVELVPKSQ
jgi:hypothetical protein